MLEAWEQATGRTARARWTGSRSSGSSSRRPPGFTGPSARPLERQCDLAGQDFEILIRLARTPGGRLRMSDLAAQTGLTPSGLTRAIDRLSDSGLVKRQACPEDRRGAFAALTEAGEQRMREALELHRSQLAELLDGALDPEEELVLVSTLRKLRDRVNPEASFLTP